MNDNPDTVVCTPTPADSGSNVASGTSDRRWRMAICTGTLLVAAFLLFWNLGSYSLWSDEVLTALGSETSSPDTPRTFWSTGTPFW